MSKALVVLSGGQDSTTCLYWAKMMFDEVHSISFDYGQRHRSELEAAAEIATRAGVKSHVLLDIKSFGSIARSALTDHTLEVNANGGLNHLPSTFTPGRNLVFLTMASSRAIALGIYDLVTGVCQTDFSGYPDCRRETVDAVEKSIALGNPVPWFVIHTPLMRLTKWETVKLAKRLPGCWEALALSITCYEGRRPPCGECPACALRAKGFHEAMEEDPALPRVGFGG